MAPISVIIPTVNMRPKYLLEALASVENQSLKPDEVIVVVDRQSSSIHKNIMFKRSLNLQILSTKRDFSGVSCARNLGATSSKCPWLAFLDDDDLWQPQYLQSCYEKALENQSNLICASFLEFKKGVFKKEKEISF